MKKYVFTESQVKKVIDTVIKEQPEEWKFTIRVQKFLNHIFKNDKTFKPLKVDGLTGRNSETAAAIEKLQRMIGHYPTDGIWGRQTADLLKEKRPDLYKIWEDNYKPGFFSDWF